MEDTNDIILCLYPNNGAGFRGAKEIMTRPENKSRLLKDRRSNTQKQPRQRQRAGTESPVEPGNLNTTDCLVIRFSHGAKTSLGVVGGRNANADLTFPQSPGLSDYHLAFTFDAYNRPMVRDLGSRGGIKVTYDGEKGDRLADWDWPLLGPSLTSGGPPILNITDDVQFKVVVPRRDLKSAEYIEQVQRFRVATADPHDILASMIIASRNRTDLPTEQEVALQGVPSLHDYFEKEIGRGAFGTVYFIWNKRTGDEYVVKRPLQERVNTGQVEVWRWEREARIMKMLSHAHIVSFRRATFDSWPMLEFEYVHGGSLSQYHDLSSFEIVQILCQLSSALKYLHTLRPPVGHRDIKPDNILVQRRENGGIYVKFADFGLSRDSDTMTTTCGSPFWAPPEIQRKFANVPGSDKEKYSVAVDIWSLGLVIAKLECGGKLNLTIGCLKDASVWAKTVRNYVKKHIPKRNTQLLNLLLDHMLFEKPEERSSAGICHDRARELLESMTSDNNVVVPEQSMFEDESVIGPDSGRSEAPTPRSCIDLNHMEGRHEDLSAIEQAIGDGGGSPIAAETAQTAADVPHQKRKRSLQTDDRTGLSPDSSPRQLAEASVVKRVRPSRRCVKGRSEKERSPGHQG